MKKMKGSFLLLSFSLFAFNAYACGKHEHGHAHTPAVMSSSPAVITIESDAINANGQPAVISIETDEIFENTPPPKTPPPRTMIQLRPIITSDMATQIAQAALDAAAEESKKITVTVVDGSGQILAVLRHHDAGVHTLSSSYKKAYTANSQKRETAAIGQGIKEGKIPEDIRYLDENILILDGGVPIVVDGFVIGAIGVGGAHGSEDVRFAKAGIEHIFN